MIKNRKQENFNPVRVISRRTFQNNRARNITAVLAILMTTLMFTTLFTLARSMSENLVRMTFRQTGYDAQASCKDITPEQAQKLAAHPDVKELGESIVLGIAENSSLRGRQVEIRWADDSYAAHSFAAPAAGRMPQSAGEAALDTITLDRLGVPHEIGQEVILEWRKDSSDPGAEPVQAAFTLCGFWEGNASSYASMAWVSREYADAETSGVHSIRNGIMGLHMAQVSLYSDNNIETAMEQILADTGLDGLEYGVNLAYSPEMGAMALQETLPMYLGMVLVFIAGYLIIYNIFQISVTADVQFYGKLKTLGTTNRQIRRVIYGQAIRLCIIGIPAGLVLGWLLGMVLVPAFTGILKGDSIVSAHPLIFVGSAVFAWLTVFISCLHPARLAGKVSPVEALRMSDADPSSGKGQRKKTKRSHTGESLAGMAWENLGRNRKRTVTVICSLTLGLVLLSCFYAKNAAFDMEKYLAELTIADFELSDATSEDYIGGYDPRGTTLENGLVQELETMEGVEAVGRQYSHQFVWQFDDQTTENLKGFYTETVLADWARYDPPGVEAFHHAVDTQEMNAVVYGLDGIALNAAAQPRYVIEGSFDPDLFSSGDYVLAVGPAVADREAHPVLPVPSVGSTVALEGRNYTVMAVVLPLNPVDDGASEAGTPDAMEQHFILPADTFRQNWPENTLRRLFLDVDDAHISTVQNWLDDYTAAVDASLPVTSRLSMAQQYETQTRSAAVMGNTISVVIALVGVLNFVNSMVTAIVSRRREFAMIQSVGMTRKQLCRMLVYEGCCYAVITLAASYLVSALAVGVVIRGMVAGGFTTFRFTLLPLVLCTPILLAFAVLIPFACFRNLERQSIVERLRMD